MSAIELRRRTALLELHEMGVRLGGSRPVELVRGVSLALRPGHAVALVGEEGGGQSLVARALVGLLPPGAERVGVMALAGIDLDAMPGQVRRRLRAAVMGFAFGEPLDGFHPILSVGQQLVDTVGETLGLVGEAALDRARAALERVGAADPDTVLASRIADLPPGARQRAMLAMATVCEPILLILDEPPVPLDPIERAHLADLLRRLMRQARTSLVLVTGDVELACAVADQAVVFYAGEVIESGPIAEVLGRPCHPYTRALLGAMPLPRMRRARLQPAPGQPPEPGQWPEGCRFAPRCDRTDIDCLVPPPVESFGARRFRCIHPHRELLS